MIEKEKIELEFSVNSSPGVLFFRLSDPSGLREWFADDVKLSNNIFTFIWGDSSMQAQITDQKEEEFIKFKWLDEDNKNSYMEFRIHIQELTEETALIITDFTEPDEKQSTIEVWEKQVSELRKVLGV
jgi:uncharacterized protein YndB with AHSA1/START domain